MCKDEEREARGKRIELEVGGKRGEWRGGRELGGKKSGGKKDERKER